MMSRHKCIVTFVLRRWNVPGVLCLNPTPPLSCKYISGSNTYLIVMVTLPLVCLRACSSSHFFFPHSLTLFLLRLGANANANSIERRLLISIEMQFEKVTNLSPCLEKF